MLESLGSKGFGEMNWKIGRKNKVHLSNVLRFVEIFN